MNAELIIDHRTQAETLVHRIYQHVAAQPLDEPYSLFGGQAGFALFEAYYHRQFGIEDSLRVWDRLSACIDAIAEGKVIYPFADGMAGIAWSFLHLANNGFLADSPDDPQDIVTALDEPLFLLAMEDLAKGNYDYMHGGLSSCLYFLERRPSPEIAAYITQLVDQLATIAISKNEGELTWVFPNFGNRKPEDPITYNLGLSHGTASIVALLCQIYKRGYAKAQCARMIDGTLRWMWTNRNTTSIALFPNCVMDEHPDEYSRLAWCYGDLGIANTFWLAGETLQNDHWKQIAEQAVLKAATRCNRRETSIADAGLCHGSAGVAHLFARFADHDPAPILEKAAQYWLDDTFSRALPLEENATFLQCVQIDDSDLYRPALGLLEGEAGIGMILLTYLGASPAWERAFLLR